MRPAIGAVTVVQFRLMRALSSAAFRLHAGLVRAQAEAASSASARDAVISDQRRVALGFLAIRDHQRLRLLQRGRRFVPVAR